MRGDTPDEERIDESRLPCEAALRACDNRYAPRSVKGLERIMAELPSGTVTFLFTDIEGSTALWERDRQAMAKAVERLIGLLDAAVQAHGGIHFKTIGDAVQAAFPTAPQAVAGAVDGQRSLLAEDWGEIGPIQVRMALHAGEAIPDERGDYLAAPLNRLSRLLSTGYGGQILLSQTVQQLTRGVLPPSVELRDLGEHRLRDLLEPERIFQVLHPDLPAQFPLLKSLENRPNNLPLQPTPFLGRDAVVPAVGSLLQRPDVRLLTLTGPGGTGKTRLALHVAAEHLDDFADGAFFVSLASLADSRLVPSAIAEALGIREEGSQPLEARLRDSLSSKALLLILDNFEHLIEAAPMVADLLSSAPKLKILITSRVPLRLRAEQEYSVPTLEVPRRKPPPTAEQLTQYEAVRLFIGRAQAVRADFTVSNDNAPAIAEICYRLDGLPLAIELAAARVRMLSPQAMLARLEQRLPLLTGGARDAPQRQRTLRNTIAWSYDLLEPDEQRLFRRFAVFAGGASVDAVEAVANADGDLDIFGGLERLVEHNLIRQEAGIEAEPRFTMLQTIREFGLEQLQTVSDAAEVRSRHATFFLELSEEAEAQRRGPDQGTWRQRLETEHDNLRAALSWLIETDTEMALLLARLLSDFWQTRGHLREGRAWLERVLAAGEQAPPRARMAVLNALASIAGPQGDYERVATAAEEALGYARDLGETGEAAWSLMMLGGVAFISGDYSRATVLTQEALELRRTLDQKTNVALILMNLSVIAMAQTDYGRAGSYLDEALQLMREAGNEEVLAKVLESMGWLALKQNQYAQAALLLRESLALYVKVGARRQVAECMRGLAEVALLIGQPGQSARLHAAAEALREEVGAALEPAERAEHERSVAVIRGDIDEAAFADAWGGGGALSLTEAVVEALAFADEVGMSVQTGSKS